MTDYELMQQALEALTVLGANYAISAKHWPKTDAAITALSDRLAQPEQEPVAVWELLEDGWDTICKADWLETLPVGTKLYTIPPQRKPLTDEEKADLFAGTAPYYNEADYADAIEARLKRKNA